MPRLIGWPAGVRRAWLLAGPVLAWPAGTRVRVAGQSAEVADLVRYGDACGSAVAGAWWAGEYALASWAACSGAAGGVAEGWRIAAASACGAGGADAPGWAGDRGLAAAGYGRGDGEGIGAGERSCSCSAAAGSGADSVSAGERGAAAAGYAQVGAAAAAEGERSCGCSAAAGSGADSVSAGERGAAAAGYAQVGAAAAAEGERSCGCSAAGSGEGVGRWTGDLAAWGAALGSASAGGWWLCSVAAVAAAQGGSGGDTCLGLLWVAGSGVATCQSEAEGREWWGALELGGSAAGSASGTTMWLAGTLALGIGGAVRRVGPLARTVREVTATAGTVLVAEPVAGRPAGAGPRGLVSGRRVAGRLR